MNSDEIHPKTQIFIDEDVSIEKAKFLIGLAVEEERLDYKAALDFSNTAKTKKSKLDIITDVMAMANTDGGYIILGISESAKLFNISGVDEECVSQTSQENLINFLKNYSEVIPKLIVRYHEIDNYKIVMIFVGKSKVPIPFKIDGQFGSNETKFRAGDIFVRHGSISIKSSYQDVVKFFEDTRLDERRVINAEGQNASDVITRLDRIIEILGGSVPSSADFNIETNSLDAVADHVFRMATDPKGQVVLRRTINKYFLRARNEVTALSKLKDDGNIASTMRITMVPIFEKILPIWSSLSDAEDLKSLQATSDQLYETWQHTFEVLDSNYIQIRLIIQSELIKIVYMCLAVSIKSDDPKSAKSLIRRNAEGFSGEHRDNYWFRYVLTWLSRTNQLKVASLISFTAESFRDNEFALGLFGSADNMLKLLAQADFLQCLNSWSEKKELTWDCWPSYRLHKKVLILPILEDVIRNYNNKWIDQVTDSELVAIWERSEQFQAPEVQRNWNWNTGYMGNSPVEALIKKVKQS